MMRHHRYHEAEAGAPSGGPGAPAPDAPPAPPPQATPPAPSAGFSQEDVNRFVAEERRKWQATQKEAADKAKREADDKAAAERGEYERLAAERGSRVATLEAEATTTAERLSAYEAEMERQIKARLRALPEEIRAMAPEADTLARFAWLDKAEAAAAKLGQAQAQAAPGTPRGPVGGGAPAAIGATGDTLQQKRASGEYAL